MIKFPFMTMQQMNLDWLLERVAHTTEVVKLSALPGDTMDDVKYMIDMNQIMIPQGICFVEAGSKDDTADKRCACLLYKIDNDNLVGFVMGIQFNIDVIKKEAGEWE